MKDNNAIQQYLIKELNFYLVRKCKSRNEIKDKLFGDNFYNKFKWHLEKYLSEEYICTMLEKITDAETNKFEHLTYFISNETDRVFSYEITNRNSNILFSFQSDIEIMATKEMINYFKALLNAIK
jgi:hypothetical protein